MIINHANCATARLPVWVCICRSYGPKSVRAIHFHLFFAILQRLKTWRNGSRSKWTIDAWGEAGIEIVVWVIDRPWSKRWDLISAKRGEMWNGGGEEGRERRKKECFFIFYKRIINYCYRAWLKIRLKIRLKINVVNLENLLKNRCETKEILTNKININIRENELKTWKI